MDWVLISFYAFATVAVVAAGAVISVRNPVHAVLCLILTFFSVACTWLLVGADTSERQKTLRRFGLATVWGTLLTALCVWVLGAAYARRTARRVREYATTCQTIMRGDLTQRLRVDGSRDEFDASRGVLPPCS